MPFPMATYPVEVFTASAMSTGQCPAHACTTNLMFIELGVKGQPISSGHSASVQWPWYTLHMPIPMANVQCRNLDTTSCCPFSHRHCNESNGFEPCLWHGWLHAHAQPQNHGRPLNINLHEPHVCGFAQRSVVESPLPLLGCARLLLCGEGNL